MSDVLDAVRDIGTAFEDYKKTADVKTKELRDRIETMEAVNERPGKAASKEFSHEQNEYKGVFLEWMRRSADRVYTNRLADAQHELGKKDVSIGSNAAGGYALPEEISRAIEHRERQLNPFRKLVRVDQCSTNDYKALVSMGDGTAGWVSETGTRTATDSPTLRERAPTFGEQYAYPTASQWSLDDIFFNVQQWLVDEVSAEWASQEATAIISGNGSDKPTGLLNTTPSSSGDSASPMRGAATLQYIPLASSPSSPFTAQLKIDSLIDLVSNVKEKYLAEADKVAFVMHRLTAANLRKLKSSSGGDYMWQESSQAGQPAMLLGYPVYTCDAMSTIAANSYSVLFGNFARGYLLVDRVGMRVLPNPYSTPGRVSFYCSRRVGGTVLNSDAVKVLKVALS